MPFYIWMLWFVVLLPALAYLAARRRDISHKRLWEIKLIALALPLSMCIFAFLANYVGLELNNESIRASSETPREFFIALDKAEKPFVTTVFVIVLLQLLLTLYMAVALTKTRLSALAFGISGLHLSVIAGFFVLNILLGEWPRS